MALLGLSGCGGSAKGPKLYPVSGKVTFQGQPPKEGQLSIVNHENGFSLSLKLEDGNYKTELPVGIYKIAVMPPPFVGGMTPEGGAIPPPPPPADIPVRYSNLETSGFKLEVKADGKNEQPPFEMSP